MNHDTTSQSMVVPIPFLVSAKRKFIVASKFTRNHISLKAPKSCQDHLRFACLTSKIGTKSSGVWRQMGVSRYAASIQITLRRVHTKRS